MNCDPSCKISPHQERKLCNEESKTNSTLRDPKRISIHASLCLRPLIDLKYKIVLNFYLEWDS